MYGDVMIQLLSDTESELWTVREISVTMVSELYRSFSVSIHTSIDTVWSTQKDLTRGSIDHIVTCPRFSIHGSF